MWRLPMQYFEVVCDNFSLGLETAACGVGNRGGTDILCGNSHPALGNFKGRKLGGMTSSFSGNFSGRATERITMLIN